MDIRRPRMASTLVGCAVATASVGGLTQCSSPESNSGPEAESRPEASATTTPQTPTPTATEEPMAAPTGKGRTVDWQDSRPLAQGDTVGLPAASFDPTLGTAAVWHQEGQLRIRIEPPGGGWQPPTTIPGSSNAANEAPVVAADGTGAVTVAWVRQRPKLEPELVVATRSPSGTWTAPRTLSEVTPYQEMEDPLSEPKLAVGADGSAVVGWTWGDDETIPTRPQVAYRPAGGEWQQTTPLAEMGGVFDAGIDDDGVATIVYVGEAGLVAARSRDGTFSDTETVPASGEWGEVDLAVGSDGTAAVAWTLGVGADYRVLVSNREEEEWTKPSHATGPGWASFPQVALQDGTTTVAYSLDAPGGGHALQTVTRPPGGDFGQPVTIDPPAVDRSLVGLWTNDTGQTLLTWGNPSAGGPPNLEGSYRASPAGTWTAPEDISGAHPLADPFAGPGAAVVHPDGSVRVLWSSPSDGSQIRSRDGSVQ